MDPNELKKRNKVFALRVIRLCAALSRNPTCDVIGRQLLRAATSVGANYRAACRARSKAEFCSKLAIVEEEADECVYWMELLLESEQIGERKLASLLQEANELTAIFSASRKTAKRSAAIKTVSTSAGTKNRKSAIADRKSQ